VSAEGLPQRAPSARRGEELGRAVDRDARVRARERDREQRVARAGEHDDLAALVRRECARDRRGAVDAPSDGAQDDLAVVLATGRGDDRLVEAHAVVRDQPRAAATTVPGQR
jgi:hypothetical protein